jgi:uncharacterized repeat protein (TIGR03803 family)
MIKPNLVRTLILAGGFLLHSTLCFQANGAANDAFTDAQILSGSSGTTSGDNIGATKQSSEPDHADNSGGSSVWFRWTAPGTGQFFFSTVGSDFDTLLAVYTGNNVNNLTPVASNDDANTNLTSAVSIQATSGTTYRVAVDGYDGATGVVALAWGPEVPPANDNFTNAQVISGTAGSVSGTNIGATKETGEPDHAGGPGGRSIWFRWTAPSTNEVSITTAGSDFDTTLAVYSGTSVNALVEVASNDEFEADSTSAVTFVPSAGTTYRIAVDGYSGQMGAVMLNWVPFDNGAEAALAVTFSPLRHFTNDINGFWPEAPVIGFGNRLYGTTITHNPGAGTIFALNPDGTGFTLLKTLNGGVADGANPEAPLIASGDTLYGTLSSGGAGFRGAVFAIKTNGTGFNLLHSFTTTSGPLLTNADGAGPRAGLVLSGDTLYGVAQTGGNSGSGTVFSLKTNGTAFTTLHHFPEILGVSETNSQGAKPVSSLVITGDTLFGVAAIGGNLGYGTVFTLKTNGTGFGTLRHFNGTDGLFPQALILSGNFLYGTTFETLFAMNTNGTGFTNLASFVAPGRGTPHGPIVVSGDRIYGSTSSGGAADKGTIYSVRTNGTGYVMLHQFPPTPDPASTNSDGALPRGVSLFGNALYGTAEVGGTWGYGTVFRLSFPPPVLAIVPDGTNVLLKWPASPGGFYVQTATNLAAPEGWTSNFSVPEIVNGRNTVTNPATGTQMFFRLKSQ